MTENQEPLRSAAGPLPYDPMNPIFGPTDVGLSTGLEETTEGPVAFMGFRTSNTTFTVPFDNSAELEQFIDECVKLLKVFKAAEVRAQFALPKALLLPNSLQTSMTPPGPQQMIPRVSG